MKQLFVLLIATGMIIFQSCDSNDSKPEGPSASGEDVLLPLDPSFYWIYEVKVYDEMGNIKESSFDTMKVKNLINMESEIWYMISFFGSETPYFVNRPDGLHIYGYPDENEIMFYKYPASPGDNWVINDKSVKVASVNEKINVEAGNFTCYRYDIKNTADSLNDTQAETIYFYPGIGLVKDIYSITQEDGTVDKTFASLIDFKSSL